jgi:putative cell wall-binding protein
MPTMRRTSALLLAVSLLASSVALPAPTVFAGPTPPRIAIVYSDVAHDAVMPPFSAGATEPIQLNRGAIDLFTDRLAPVESFLQSEFGTATVTRIGDAELASAAALKPYDVVVLVRQLAATGAQRQALQEYVASGGSLVCSFGTGRWDYDPARTSQPYYPLVFLAGSSLLEWGELSETMQVGFVNDPKMIAGFHVAGHPSGAGHQILVDSAAQAGVPSIDMTASISDCPELVRTFSAAGTIPLLMYDQATTEQDGVRNAVSGSLAAWISNYYMGRVVYFGFQLHDLIRGGDYGSPETKLQARRLLANSVRWAMRDESYGRVYKGPVMTASGGMSSGKLRVSGRVANGGSVQIDGSMMVRVLDPRGRVVYENGVKRSSMTLAPGGSCSLDWLVPVGTKPAKGRWTAVVYYTYWDRFRGGAGVASRVAWFSSNGKTLTYAASPAQGLIAGALPPGGPSFAGADRYEVAAAAAAAGWPSGLTAPTYGIILATGTRPAEALAAAPFAGKIGAPLLLTKPDRLSPATAGAITRLSKGKPSVNIYIVGTTKSVSNAVGTQAVAAARRAGVRGAVRIHRIAGTDDAGTAAALAGAVGVPTSGPFAHTAFIVNAATYADGLSLGPIAARHKVPVLFVTYGGVPAVTQAALARLGVKHCVIFGGPGSVTPTVEDWLEGAGRRVPGQPDNAAGPDTRLWGATRYDVSEKAIRYAGDYAQMDVSGIGIANGEKWPDALSAGPMLGRTARPILLMSGTDGNNTPMAMQYLMDRRGSACSVTFFGGWASMTDFVRGQVGFMLAR